MEFHETLLAAQRNQQQKSSENSYYKARFDPPKKEQKVKDKLSANIQKFLAKKDEEERQKKLDAQRKREELLAMRDPKALRKIQKTLKVIKSANKSVIADAIDRENTAVTIEGPDQPDQDDYGYESQEAAALYKKMMQKYSKIPDEPKFPVGKATVVKDLNGTRERVRNALLHEDDPVPHKRRRRTDNGERESSPPTKYEPEKEKKRDEKPDKPKIRKPAPPPMDFNQLLKLAEQKKSEPIDVAAKKAVSEPEPDRLMTKKQRREYEEEMARRQRRQEAEKSGTRKVQKEDRTVDKERKTDSNGFGRIPKLGDKNISREKNDQRPTDREKERHDMDKADRSHKEKDSIRLEKDKLEREMQRIDKERYDQKKEKRPQEREKTKQASEKEKAEKIQRETDRIKLERDRVEKEMERIERERFERLKAERDRIDRELEQLNKDRDKLDKKKAIPESSKSDKIYKSADKNIDRSKLSNRDTAIKQDVTKSIDLKSQNTYRIDRNSNEKKVSLPTKSIEGRVVNGHSSQGKPVPKLNKEITGQKNGIENKMLLHSKQKSNESSPKSNGYVPRKEDVRKLQDNKGMPPKRSEEKRPQPVAGSSRPGNPPKVSNSFDFDKHVNGLKNSTKQFPPGDVRRKVHPDDIRKKQKRGALDSDSERDSEMDDFIDDGDEEMDYSRHIKEIFGYDKSKYRDMDDDDDPTMESSFARQQREEYISKKIGIMEDLEDMRMEAMEKKKSKRRRISDD